MSFCEQTVDNKLQILQRIDELIGNYYDKCGMYDYFNNYSQNGRFMQYIIDEELDDDDILLEDELGNDAVPTDCIYVEFDIQGFPVWGDINYNLADKKRIVFYIIQYCYKHSSLPDIQYLKQSMHHLNNTLDQSIADVFLLETEKRNRCLTLIYKIINNIIYNPNEPKYQSIDSFTLSQKISNHQILFNILLNAGFYKSNKKKKLMFDKNKLSQLKYAKNMLLARKYLTTQVPLPLCICGGSLVLLEVNECYGGNEVCCDVCNESMKEGTNVYHCKETNDKHTHGYDLCKSCGDSRAEQEIVTVKNNCRYDTQKCKLSIAHCCHLQNLMKIICKYHENQLDYIMDNAKIRETLNDYAHLIMQHDTDEEFEFIANQFGICDLEKCPIFKRNNRNRDSLGENDRVQLQHKHLARNQILDKIHCYFAHCYDIGNRLSMEEMAVINARELIEEKRENECFINEKLVKYTEILHCKQKNINYRTSKKYNDRLYSFGFQFRYGFEFEKPEFRQLIKPKYSNLKEELTTNPIATITIEQFMNEYKKAEIHFGSCFVKTSFPTFIDLTYSNKEWTFCIEYLLSLLFYCNFTLLQYEFSKTYRHNEGKDHNNFYYLGKYLKISV
eukprot:172_1